MFVVVGADGTPQDIQVLSPLEPSLDEAATQALAKWRFKPGVKVGAPVSTAALVVMGFRVM
jgi:TonB family protein